eukprot:Phypoly_transcript_16689.p1 GENE.Phypoly_transcript_16689~~Phypoly_transcript_16689.p1  ORF type:complete len:233 (+),score=27.78 Phypoly_transcript_16689:111-809(+)
MNHLINESEITFDLISESDVHALTSSKIMLRDRFGGYLHVEAKEQTEVCELYVVNKECPPPLHYFVHYGVILSNLFDIGSTRKYNYMLIHALRYEDRLKYQIFFTNNLESAKRKACIMEGQLRLGQFKSISASANSALRWLEVLKKHIGTKISKTNEGSLRYLTAVREFYAVVNDKNAERLGKNTERALQASLDEFSVSPQTATASLSDNTFNDFVQKFIERSALYADSEVV